MTAISPSLQFRTVQLGSPRKSNEGLRIGAVRYLPRGVPKNEYATRDLFDLWLPTLAPSRDLLQEYKDNGLKIEQFFRRYRREMSETDARQTIVLLAEMANLTPLSVGCYCEDESTCHRSVLGELIRVAAGESPRPLWADQGVYTIVHLDQLRMIHKSNDGSGTLTERKRWTTAEKLLDAAAEVGERVAILFGDATDCSKLLYAAQLDRVTIDGDSTKYQFSHLHPLSGRHTPQELTLCSTGQQIAPGFIRPYAIVERPKFLPD